MGKESKKQQQKKDASISLNDSLYRTPEINTTL